MSKGIQRYRGNVAIITALLVAAVFTVVALGLDVSWLVAVAAELQATADGSAMAGARRVRTNVDLARKLCVDIGEANIAAYDPVKMGRNDSNAPEGDVVLGRFDVAADLFIPSDFSGDHPDPWPNAVKAVARRTEASLSGPLNLTFAPAVGIDTTNLSRLAIAMIEGSIGDGIIALCPDCKCAFKNNGTPLFHLGDAAIHVNSDHNCASCGVGNSETVAAEMNAAGGICMNGQAEFSGAANEGEDPIPDPLADLNAPGISDFIPDCEPPVEGTLSPGYYPSGISHPSGDVTLSPGVYYLDGILDPDQPSRTVDFDDGGEEAGITPTGTADFDFAGSSWTGGVVDTYEATDGAQTFPMAVSGSTSYGFLGAGTVTLEHAVSEVTFFFAHDGVAIPPGQATVIDVCGDTVAVVDSTVATLPLNQHMKTVTAGDMLIKSIDFTGGVVDAFTFTQDEEGGLSITGGTFQAEGVMFYIAGGSVKIAGNAAVTISPPQDGYYQGVSFFQARNNANGASITGTSETDIEGILYFPGAELKVAGTPESFGNQLIAWTIKISGTSDMYLEYDGVGGDPDLRVFLVR